MKLFVLVIPKPRTGPLKTPHWCCSQDRNRAKYPNQYYKPSSQTIGVKVRKHHLIPSGSIRRERQAMACARLQIDRDVFRSGIEPADVFNVVDIIAVSIADGKIVLSHEYLLRCCCQSVWSNTTVEQASERQDLAVTHLDRPRKIQSRLAKCLRSRNKLPHGRRLLDELGIAQQLRLEGPFLEEDLLDVAQRPLHDIPRGTISEADGVALGGEFEPKRRLRHLLEQVLVAQQAGEDGAVAQAAVARQQARRHEGAVRVADVHDLPGHVRRGVARRVGERGAAAGGTACHPGGGQELAGAGELREAADDLDLDAGLQHVVGVRLGGVARAEAVVGEDGVAVAESRVDVRVFVWLDLDIPVSAFA